MSYYRPPYPNNNNVNSIPTPPPRINQNSNSAAFPNITPTGGPTAGGTYYSYHNNISHSTPYGIPSHGANNTSSFQTYPPPPVPPRPYTPQPTTTFSNNNGRPLHTSMSRINNNQSSTMNMPQPNVAVSSPASIYNNSVSDWERKYNDLRANSISLNDHKLLQKKYDDNSRSSVSREEYVILESKNTALQKQHTMALETINELRGQLESLRTHLTDFENKSKVNQEDLIKSWSQNNEALTSMNMALENDKIMMNTKIGDLNKEILTLKQELLSEKTTAQEKDTFLSQLSKQLNDMTLEHQSQFEQVQAYQGLEERLMKQEKDWAVEKDVYENRIQEMRDLVTKHALETSESAQKPLLPRLKEYEEIIALSKQELEEAVPQIAVLSQKVENLEKERDIVVEERNKLTEEFAVSKKDSESLRRELCDAQEKSAKLQVNVKNLQDKVLFMDRRILEFNSGEMTKESEEYQKEKQELMKHLEMARAEKTQLESNLKSLREDVIRSEEICRIVEKSRDEFEQYANQMQDALEQTTSMLYSERGRVENFENALKKRNKEFDSLLQLNLELQRQIQRK